MKNWYKGDYSFKITVLPIKPANKPENRCRNGHEVGDRHIIEFDCPNSVERFKLEAILE